MDPRITAALASEHGLITRARALDLGMSPSEIRTRLRHREWVVVRRGVYCSAEVWAALDEYVGRPRLRARAAILTIRRAWVLSHDSAAHELGMAILAPPDPLVHITRPGWTNAWTEHGVKHHLARFRPEQVVDVNGLRALDLARTAVDIARERGVRDGLVACDAALRLGVARSALVAAHEPMENWPGVQAARTSTELADPGAENPNESLGRELVLEAGIGEPETQFPVMTAQGPVWCDIRVGNHVVECDGAIKYRSPEDGGVAERPLEDVLRRQRERERLVRDEGLGVTRLVWADYWGSRREAAIRRLRADAADSASRFGVELAPRLVEQAARIRRDHGDRRRPA